MKKLLTILPCLAILLFGCVSQSAKKETENSVKMGVIIPLSGSNAIAAAEILGGMKVATEELNKSGGLGGKKLVLDVRDSATKDFAFSETLEAMRVSGTKIFHIALDDKIVANYKTFPRLEDCFFNLMTTYPPATTGAKNVTRIFVNGAQEGDLLTEQIAEAPVRQNYVVMSQDTLSGRSNAGYFKFNLNRGKAKTFSDVFGANEKNFSVFGAQIARLNPRYVFYIGTGKELNAFSESVKKSNFQGTLLATCGLEPLSSIQVRDALRFGKLCTAFELGKVDNPNSKNFRKSYKAKFAKDATFLSAFGYDSIMLCSRADNSGKADSATIRKFFENAKYEGAIGKLSFDSSADSTAEYEIVEIKKNK